MFYSVSLFSQAPLARGSRALSSVLYYMLHTEHAYCLSYRCLNNVVITTVIEMVEMVEILDGRLGKHSVERVRYVINNLLHLVIFKYGVTSLVLCISTRLRLVTMLSLLMKYLVIFHADPCNKSYSYTCTCTKHTRELHAHLYVSQHTHTHTHTPGCQGLTKQLGWVRL